MGKLRKCKSDDLNDDLNIDDYISDDDTPFYKTSSNNTPPLKKKYSLFIWNISLNT